jgi:ATP-dependent protease HslVU (ClpYQ) peptidase subunit
MTCIVGYVDKDYIYMGADSFGSNGHFGKARKDTKLFTKLVSQKYMLIGYTSSFRMGQLLKWKFTPPEIPEDMNVEKYMNTLFIDEVIKCFTENGYGEIDKNVKSGGTFLVGYKGRLFEIEDDYQVGEFISPIGACGCGFLVARGAMEALLKYDKNIKPERLLRLALEISAGNLVGVGGPFKIMRIKNI